MTGDLNKYYFMIYLITSGYAALARHNSRFATVPLHIYQNWVTVASRLWLCIFIKRGNSTSRFATVLPTWRPREPLTAKDRRGVICRVTVAKRLLPNFVKYADEAWPLVYHYIWELLLHLFIYFTCLCVQSSYS